MRRPDPAFSGYVVMADSDRKIARKFTINSKMLQLSAILENWKGPMRWYRSRTVATVPHCSMDTRPETAIHQSSVGITVL